MPARLVDEQRADIVELLLRMPPLLEDRRAGDGVDAEPGWEIAAPYPFSVVCFRRAGSDEENEALLERVNATGEVFLSHTRLRDRYVLRLAIGHAATTEEDVSRAWELLRSA